MIAQYIDHTLLKPNAVWQDFEQLCNDALEYGFFSVCIPPYWVKRCSDVLSSKASVKICTVIGFPLGYNTLSSKLFEAKQALDDSADELDMVINLGAFKNEDYAYVANEIYQLKQTAGNHILKVIIETGYLNSEEIRTISKICSDNGADFVKTSTGFGPRGASVEDIKHIQAGINAGVNIKASGGIRDYKTAKTYLDLGVTRLGTSSGIAIIKGKNDESTY